MPHSCMESTSLCNSCCLLLRVVRMIHYVSITWLDCAAENQKSSSHRFFAGSAPDPGMSSCIFFRSGPRAPTLPSLSSNFGNALPSLPRLLDVVLLFPRPQAYLPSLSK